MHTLQNKTTSTQMIKHILTHHPNYNLKSYMEYHNDIPYKESKKDNAANDFSEGKKKTAKAFFGERKNKANAGPTDFAAKDKRAADRAEKKQKPSHFELKDAAKRGYKKR